MDIFLGAIAALAFMLFLIAAYMEIKGMSEALDNLSKEVSEAVATMGEATELIVNLARQIGDAINDPPRLATLTKHLDETATALEDTITRIKSGAQPLE